MRFPFAINDLRSAISKESRGRRVFHHPSSIANHKFQRAFSLIEMLVVLGIMAILAALAVPALKNFGQSDAMTAADQQLLGDVARARQLAMSQRTTVYMVFVPTNFWNLAGFDISSPSLSSAQRAAATNLCGYQLTGYTFMSYGNVGDQPGQHVWKYLAQWQALPQGTFIAQQKFAPSYQYFYISYWDKEYHNKVLTPIYGFDTDNFALGSAGFPFPTADSSAKVLLPYIAFNYFGQLTTNGIDAAAVHEYIPLARGSILPALNPDTRAFQFDSPSVIEKPPGNSTNTYNIIDIDPLTGRATLQTPQVK